MISVENLSKSFGAQLLFDNINLKINRRERVGLVGRNGHGKTTLFRIIAGLESADSGAVSIPKNYRIGYVEQEPVFKEHTVLAEAVLGLPPAERDRTWRAEKILAGLGFEARDISGPPGELSGGFQVRLNLAKVLLADFDMLLLDEPNNYLDVTSIRWLERFLKNWPGEFLLITHDRSFMDSVVTHVLGIHRKKVRRMVGDTGKYYTQIAQDEEIYEKTRLNDERKRKEIQNFIDKFRASAQLTGLVQSRIKTLSKMEKREKLEKIATLDFTFASKPFHGKYALNLSEVFFFYDPARPLIRDFSVTVGARDRICVIGKNGKGKTTLLKLMAGVLVPLAGEVSKPLNAAAGYFEQSYIAGLDESRTVLEEIMTADPDRDPGRSRAICGGMLFEQDDALKKIGILSGGEKSRVVLGKLIATPFNLLLLDEPSNHLDLESNDALLAALDNFEGAVVMVTHNEMFLHALAERLIVFQGDQISVYEGDYERFLEKVGWQDEADNPRPGKPAEKEKPNQRDMRRLRSAVLSERARALKPLEKRADDVEAEIEAKEAELESLNQAIIEASQGQMGQEIVDISRRMHQLKKEIDFLYGELDTLTRDIEEKKAHFDREIAGLTS
ncbi:MAG: ABC transporter ATP-binding protein [Candidatus Aminicenantes bacterium RBG_16_63_16]|nr:MAG: ABC transporter ATP-binding protein [Candidatus Aminicenantes bacterium RBG_16_63_16]